MVTHIQRRLGRRSVPAAGNTGGDWQMLEAAAARPDGPSLAVLVDNDDFLGSAPTRAEPRLSPSRTDPTSERGWDAPSSACPRLGRRLRAAVNVIRAG